MSPGSTYSSHTNLRWKNAPMLGRAEAKKMREVVEKESVAHVAAVKNATDAIVKGLEDGSLSVKVFDGTNSTNPLLQAYDKVMTDYDSWAVSKSKEIDKLLAVE